MLNQLTILFIAILLCFNIAFSKEPSKKIKAAYEKVLVQANLDERPERHKFLKSWCLKKRWKDKAKYHDLEYRKYQYNKKKSNLKKSPSGQELKALLQYAKKLKLPNQEEEAHELWIRAEIKQRNVNIGNNNNIVKMKSFLSWLINNKAYEEAKLVAINILKIESDNVLSHKILGHIKIDNKWLDPWEYLKSKNGLKDIKARYAVHKFLHSSKGKRQRNYPSKPMANYEKVVPGNGNKKDVWRVPIKGNGDGKGLMYAWRPQSYTSSRSWPLIVYLHGGGSGGISAANHTASNNLAGITWYDSKLPYVMIAPVVRNHVINSWNIKENMLDVVDGIIHVCKLFNIDKKKIYLLGSSMGGQGTARFSFVIPECFAAFSPSAGAYWNKHVVPDLTGKSFLVCHGGKDQKFRNKSLDVFMKKIKKANSNVELLFLKDEGHSIPKEKYYPKLFTFLKRHVNDFSPDLTLVRKIISETVTEKPHGKK
ncbi:MAG: hypothetical protein COA79_18175 [Planctomycetota bacterium]|nr:MAG: hypothetical protein COA79_18175 [Planctomycetota bacterium]